VVNNAIASALLITAAIAVIAMSLYHNVIEGGGIQKALKGCLYIFLSSLVILHTHYYTRKQSIMHGVLQSKREQNVNDIIRFSPTHEPISYLNEGPYVEADNADNDTVDNPTTHSSQVQPALKSGMGEPYLPNSDDSSSLNSQNLSFSPVEIIGQVR
jgi:hypothetical protein